MFQYCDLSSDVASHTGHRAAGTGEAGASGAAARGRLAALGGIEQAVPQYYDARAWAGAAEVIAGAADTLMSIGQWETFDD